MKSLLSILLTSACLALALGSAQAQDKYPSRPIKVLVPYAPGGATDIVARVLGDRLREQMGATIVVENKPGANGILALESMARATPDGYTLMIGNVTTNAITPILYRDKMHINYEKDVVTVMRLVDVPEFLAVTTTDFAPTTVPEFVDYARAANPPLAYASGGVGSQQHFAMEVLKRRAGINLLHVPYRGGAPSATATIGGETQALFAGASSAGQFEAGNLRPLAASGKARSKRFPDIPTIGEFYPGFEVDIWLGLFAPAGTPDGVVRKIREAVHAALRRPDLAEKLNVSGSLEPLILEPAAFDALIRKDYEKYGTLVKQFDIKLD